MITAIVALMTLPCHCWGEVRLSRQEWRTMSPKPLSPSHPCTHMHAYSPSKLSLFPLVTGPQTRRELEWEVFA